jgi:hypothetical protein
MAVLTPSEKARTRYHLGYLGVQVADSLSFGQPIPIQTLFIVEAAMDHLIAEHVPKVRSLLDVLDGIECRLLAAADRLAAISLGEIKLRDNEPDMLEKEYFRWAGRLADILGVPFYAYSNRFKGKAMMGSIPVRNS